MSQRTLLQTSFTPTATADTTNLVDATYFAILQGASTTQTVAIMEIFLGGQAIANAQTFMLLARDSVIGAGVTLTSGLTDSAMDPATGALAAPTVTGNACSSTKPQRSSTLKLLNLSFNAWGGIVRWAPYSEAETPKLVGNTASLGELSLSAFTGGIPGLLGGHIIYETR